jgi:hypothetical protein
MQLEESQKELFLVNVIIVLDDPIKLSGEGKNTIKDHFENILQMCREFSVCFIFNIKEFEKIENCDIFLEIFGIKEKEEKTRCFWVNDLNERMGIVYFNKPLNFDEKEYLEFRKEKWKKWNDLIDSEGGDSAYNLEELTNEIYEELKNQNLLEEYQTKGDINDYLKKKKHFPSETCKSLSRMISGKIKIELKDNKRSEKKETLFNPLDVKITEFMLKSIEKLDSKYIEQMIENLEITPIQKKLLFLNLIGKQDKEGNLIKFGSKLLIAHLKSEEFKQSFQISNFKKNISKEIGFKMEKHFCEYLKDSGKNFDYFGGRVNLIDIINHSDRMVISLKTVWKEKDRLNHIYTLNQEEFEKAKELKYDMMYIVIVLEQQEIHSYQFMRNIINSEEKILMPGPVN